MGSKLLCALALVPVLVASCGRLGSGSADGKTGIAHPTGADEMVLRIEYCCGFVAPEYTIREVPSFSLFGDGRVVIPGPQIEIYPGPALPNLSEVLLTEDAVQAILQEARDAGLYEDRDLQQPNNVADAATTIFTVVDGDGTRHVTKAYALSDGFDDGLPAADHAARQRLYKFQEKLGDLRSWLPKGSVGEEHAYEFDSLRVFARPFGPNEADADLEQEPKDWPLSEPLSSFERPAGDAFPGLRCGTVTGQDLDLLRPEIQQSNELTPWVSDGSRYRLFLRPLLPDETGC